MAATMTDPLKPIISPKSTRDLRAAVVDMAASLLERPDEEAVLTIKDLRMSRDTVQNEWDRILKTFRGDVQSRLTLTFDEPSRPATEKVIFPATRRLKSIRLDPPNFRFEVLRQLIGADIARRDPMSVAQLVKMTGASHFTVRKVLDFLTKRGVVRQSNPTNARYAVIATEMTRELLGVVHALPQMLRFQYEAGARPRSTPELVERFEKMQDLKIAKGWENLALSGVSATNPYRLPTVDLLGVPRLDLCAYVGKDAKMFDASMVRMLDDGLEYVPDVRANASLVISIVQSDPEFNHPLGLNTAWRHAQGCDIYMAMLDAGLREQAVQFAMNKGMEYQS